jgi:SAM-dependent methyltransferase
MRNMTGDSGWDASAQAWIDAIGDDPNRNVLLDPEMLDVCGDVRGKRVLDVGCGEGRFCRMLAGRGAEATGIDPTPGLIAEAERRGAAGAYVRGVAEQLPFADAAYDLVISYVTLVDIAGYREAIAEMTRVLRPGGSLVACNLGFVTATPAAPGDSPWVRDAGGKRLYYPTASTATRRSSRPAWRGRASTSSTGTGRRARTCRRISAPACCCATFANRCRRMSRCATTTTSRTGSACPCSTSCAGRRRRW